MLGKYSLSNFLEIMRRESLTGPLICFAREKTRKGTTEVETMFFGVICFFLRLEMLACSHFLKVLIATTAIHTGSHFGLICYRVRALRNKTSSKRSILVPFHRLLANRSETVNIKEISLESKILCRDDNMIRPAALLS